MQLDPAFYCTKCKKGFKKSAPVSIVEEKDNNKDNLVNGDFFDIFNEYFNEFFIFKQYRRIPLALAIVAGILLSPFLLATIAIIIAFYVSKFVYKLISSPADFLIQTFNKDSDSIPVKMVVYLVGYPFVFVFKMLLSIFSIMFFVDYFLLNLFGYVYSLGAMKFQPFLYEASKDCGFKLSRKASKRTISIIMIVCIFVSAIYLGLGVAKIIDVVVDNNSYTSTTKTNTNSTNTTKNNTSVINKTTNFEKDLTLYSNTSNSMTYSINVETSGYYYIKISGNDNYASVNVYIDGSLVNFTSNYSYSTSSYIAKGSHTVKVSYTNTKYYSDTITLKISSSSL